MTQGYSADVHPPLDFFISEFALQDTKNIFAGDKKLILEMFEHYFSFHG